MQFYRMILSRGPLARSFHHSPKLSSGHNKWSKIRHSKGALDAERAKLFSKISNDIAVAARIGGTSPDLNIRLAACLAKAKQADMPKSNIEAAVNRASKRSTEGHAEPFTYEATFGPLGMLIETLSDKKTRTIANLKSILKKGGGTMSPSGFLFDRLGFAVIICRDKSLDDMVDIAIEVNAQDVVQVEESTYGFTSAPADLNEVAQSIKDLGYELLEAELQYRPKEKMTVVGETRKQLEDLIEALESDADVTRVTTTVNV